MTDTLYATTMDSPLGVLTITASDAGVRAVTWPAESEGRVPIAEPVEGGPHPILEQTERQLGEYFAGDRLEFDLPLDPVGTDFQHAAWTALCTIPYGETVSYGEQAGRMGDARKARAVGAANGRNPISIIVPCHRVVGADGSLTGFAGGIDSKAWLLDHERQHTGHTLDFS
ncbi:MAG: methylated-DNA--[protein]-cysteine S-methyltransferase [Acidimicrobiia bacterium]|nr:methylated-DNA--[protein]-cysteine S-methyltransferase [Acidimicrobiia bacterium]